MIVPDLALGSHQVAMDPDANLSPPGLARLVGDLIGELGLSDVTLVGYDTGGAIRQLVAASEPEWLSRLVLTNCDAYENFLPPAFRYLQLLARIPGGMALIAHAVRLPAIRGLPIAYGWLSVARATRELEDGWVQAGPYQPGGPAGFEQGAAGHRRAAAAPRTFVPLDAPDDLADLIVEFAPAGS